jgi:hypothetical protein
MSHIISSRAENISRGSCITFATTCGDITVIAVLHWVVFVIEADTFRCWARHELRILLLLRSDLLNICFIMGKSKFDVTYVDQGLTAGCQDLLMDWSLLRPHARFMFLREELLYSSHIPVRLVSSRHLLSPLPLTAPR